MKFMLPYSSNIVTQIVKPNPSSSRRSPNFRVENRVEQTVYNKISLSLSGLLVPKEDKIENSPMFRQFDPQSFYWKFVGTPYPSRVPDVLI